jgi:hypothetical protein
LESSVSSYLIFYHGPSIYILYPFQYKSFYTERCSRDFTWNPFVHIEFLEIAQFNETSTTNWDDTSSKLLSTSTIMYITIIKSRKFWKNSKSINLISFQLVTTKIISKDYFRFLRFGTPMQRTENFPKTKIWFKKNYFTILYFQRRDDEACSQRIHLSKLSTFYKHSNREKVNLNPLRFKNDHEVYVSHNFNFHFNFLSPFYNLTTQQTPVQQKILRPNILSPDKQIEIIRWHQAL